MRPIATSMVMRAPVRPIPALSYDEEQNKKSYLFKCLETKKKDQTYENQSASIKLYCEE